MNLLVAVAISTGCSAMAFSTLSSSDTAHDDGPFIEAGTAPACPVDVFDKDLVTVTCHQDWDRKGRWFMRLRSSGIPAHSYGQAYEPWGHLVIDQQWDVTIPIITEEDEIDDGRALRKDVDPTAFLAAAAREDRPLGMALNGVPFFSPLTATGADTVNPQPARVAKNDTLFDGCAGSLQANTGAYGYRVMPPCLYGESASVPEGTDYEPERAIIGFQSTDSFESESLPSESPLLGFSMDGRRLYGPYDATQSLASGLDVCNGRWEANGRTNGTTEGAPGVMYTYRATPSFPYLIGCQGPAGAKVDLTAVTASVAVSGVDYTAVGEGFLVEVPNEGCPAGSYLNVDSGTCEACRAGTYGKYAGLVGRSCPGLCPRGYYCPDGTGTPSTRCPAGTFGAAPGMGDASCSGQCQEGYFCLSGSVAPDSYECGGVAYYCPRGSGKRKAVTKGHYTTPEVSLGSSDMEEEAARRVRSGQSQCEEGTFCLGGRRRQCPAGTFGATTGLMSSACSGPCPAGSYCPAGTIDPIPCPAGSYGDEENASTAACSGLCSKGHYCPAGSTSAFQEACPAGRFGPVRGLKDGRCVEEHACAKDQDTPCFASLCEAGYYCPPGSTSPQANRCGSTGFFCPRGSAFPTPVDVGYYAYSEDATDGGMGSSWSLLGNETRTAQMECEPGYFCIDGARLPCPAGSYGSSLGLSSPSCSGPCPAGYYCGEGLAKADLGRRCGGPQWYCPEGSGAPFEVGIGNYTVGEPPDRRAAQEVCPAGTYCQEGISRPCPAGTHGSYPGLSSPACSGLCPAGRYCPTGTASEPNKASVGIACPEGRYGHAGMGHVACTGPCEAGYFCPTSSTSARQQECGSGDHFCPEGSGAPVAVAAGWYATGGGELTREGQARCVAVGKTPPSATFIVERCPDNTVGWNGTESVE